MVAAANGGMHVDFASREFHTDDGPMIAGGELVALDQLIKDAVVALTMVELGDEQRKVVKARMCLILSVRPGKADELFARELFESSHRQLQPHGQPRWQLCIAPAQWRLICKD